MVFATNRSEANPEMNREEDMLNGMLDAVRGCLKEEIRMDVISSNLANANVVGFKKDKLSFQELLEGIQSPGTRAKGAGSQVLDQASIRIKIDQTPGDIRITGNTLDFAINGKGFFKVETAEGIRYTRKGNFSLAVNGYLVTLEGHKVRGTGGPISIQGNDVQVDGRGTIKVDGSQVGQFEVVDLESYDGLMKAGSSLFQNDLGAREVAPPAETRVQQGYVELSNVNMVDEMVQMIHCMRAFESYQKAIQVLDGLDNRVVNEVSRLR
jgi:flagellar basal-body rod protein FlgG